MPIPQWCPRRSRASVCGHVTGSFAGGGGGRGGLDLCVFKFFWHVYSRDMGQMEYNYKRVVKG